MGAPAGLLLNKEREELVITETRDRKQEITSAAVQGGGGGRKNIVRWQAVGGGGGGNAIVLVLKGVQSRSVVCSPGAAFHSQLQDQESPTAKRNRNWPSVALAEYLNEQKQ